MQVGKIVMLEEVLIGISIFPIEQIEEEEREKLPIVRAYQTGRKGEGNYSFLELEVMEWALKEVLSAKDRLGSMPTTTFLKVNKVSRKPRRSGGAA